MKPTRTAQAVETYKNNPHLTVAAAARECGVDRPTLLRAIQRAGVTVRHKRGALRGADNGGWKGGRRPDVHGYIRLLIDRDTEPEYIRSMANRDGYIPEQRYVMARQLGRALTSKETVHHINGDRADNRIENLQLRNGKHGKGVALVCGCCGSTDIREVAL